MRRNWAVFLMTDLQSVALVIWATSQISSSASTISSSRSSKPPNNFTPTATTTWLKELYLAINPILITVRVCFRSSRWFSSRVISRSSSSISMPAWAISLGTISLVTARHRCRYLARRHRLIIHRFQAITSRSMWMRSRWLEGPFIIISIFLKEAVSLTQVLITSPSSSRISFRLPQLHNRCSRYLRNHLTMSLEMVSSRRWFLDRVECCRRSEINSSNKLGHMERILHKQIPLSQPINYHNYQSIIRWQASSYSTNPKSLPRASSTTKSTTSSPLNISTSSNSFNSPQLHNLLPPPRPTASSFPTHRHHRTARAHTTLAAHSPPTATR